MSDEIRTERLLMRRWRDSDREPFAQMNADPDVMRHFVEPMTAAQTDEMIAAVEAHFDDHGFSLWALEVPGVADFIGFTGLYHPRFDAHFTPAVEVGWRLDKRFWKHGYATEAARAALAEGFTSHGLEEIVSFTSPLNTPSIAVMERIGMTRDAEGDFLHPRVPDGHPIQLHVLYRISRPA